MDSIKKAVVLNYPYGTEAPFIALNAKGFLAETVIKIAQENNVPIKKDKILAGILSLHDVGTCVPEETYEALAKIFAFLQKNERRQEQPD